MATPRPALRIMGMSLTSSPTAQIAAGSICQSRAEVQDRGPFAGVVAQDFAHRSAVSGAALNERLDPAGDLAMGGLLKLEHLAPRSDCADVKNGVARMLRRRVIRLESISAGSPSRVDFGVLAVLTDVVVEAVSPGRVGGDDEIRASSEPRSVKTTAGWSWLRNRSSTSAESDVVEIGSPDRAVAGGLFDDRPGVADQWSINLELPGDRPGATIATARAEDRPDSGPGGARDRRQRTRPQGAVGVEQRSVDIERQNLKAMSRHRFPPETFAG